MIDDDDDDDQETVPLRRRTKFIKPIGEIFKSVVCWFEGPFVDHIILHPIIRWVLLATFTAASLVFVSFAVQLRPDEEQVRATFLKGLRQHWSFAVVAVQCCTVYCSLAKLC